MPPQILSIKDVEGDRALIESAARAIERGALIAFPTETVYGLGANAEDADALARMAELKGRSADKPFAILVGELAQAERMAECAPAAIRLARELWPGPLTLVLPARRGGTVGLRMPAHPIAMALVRESRVPVAATSVNKSGEPPAVSAEEVQRLFGDRLDMILDGGEACAGVASTVIAVDATGWRVLREGALSLDEIRARLGPEFAAGQVKMEGKGKR